VRAIILILLAAAVGLGVLASQQAATIKEQQHQIAAADEHMKGASLALQGKCAEQARKAFNAFGFGPNDMADYSNHYNATLNKCMVRLERQLATGQVTYVFKNVFDAFENKDVGTYVWHTVGDKKYWEVPPSQCQVVSTSGEKQACQSEDEFNKLTDVYMNG
jgi:type II secretory pathway pseudopilin PulG